MSSVVSSSEIDISVPADYEWRDLDVGAHWDRE